eukprot:GHVT01089797.1.p1 GENE.GHVT01089797.1~~GHVT01089797.1.p1  ORF type:complete len:147 (+),score=12.17 GHVT01089797.1:2034-2474(+)
MRLRIMGDKFRYWAKLIDDKKTVAVYLLQGEIDEDGKTKTTPLMRNIEIEAQFIIPAEGYIVFHPTRSNLIYDFVAAESEITITMADGTDMPVDAITGYSPYNILRPISKATNYELIPEKIFGKQVAPTDPAVVAKTRAQLEHIAG